MKLLRSTTAGSHLRDGQLALPTDEARCRGMVGRWSSRGGDRIGRRRVTREFGVGFARDVDHLGLIGGETSFQLTKRVSRPHRIDSWPEQPTDPPLGLRPFPSAYEGPEIARKVAVGQMHCPQGSGRLIYRFVALMPIPVQRTRAI